MTTAWTAGPLWAARLAAPYLLVVARRHLDCLYLLQLERYRSDRFGRWVARHVAQLVPRQEVAIQVLTAFGAAVAAGLGTPGLILYLLWIAGGLLPLRAQRSFQVSQRLHWTARAVRVSLASWLVSAVLFWATGRLAAILVPRLDPGGQLLLGGIVGCMFTGLFMPGTVRLAARLMEPVETVVARRYLRQAAARMQRYPGRVVGVTGSYGKTTTKHIVADLLAVRFRVLMTPAGVNTTMGITRVIREDLRDEHELFVVEASAYGPGEIREVCDIVRPGLAILTAVGVQHLERFGTPERIAEAKYELIASLAPAAPAVMNADDPTCLRLSERARAEGKRVLLYGLEERPGLALSGTILGVSRRGTTFRAAAASGEAAEFQTKLLGRWNISNVLAALAAGVEYGIPLAAMRERVGALTPAPRRLEIQEEGGIVRILDVANANPRGAEMALEVLGQFTGGARILITPGMVELGPVEAEENYTLGRRAAGVCDHVVLVGPRQTAPIRRGLLDGGFPAERIVTVRQADEVAERLAGLVRPGDTLLYENRLPDTYLEVGP
ncbi:MAG: UDP-N-acetylmuramoyl-tripeptide--D-alanyl-D-alanine ligase [candidate division NC10 bacterium]|nr:UDP-N-acetylmuramoyl-tripeptide--D-alanyl-D-alanine ligase [candidate division NC10 bacterium]